MSNHLMAYGLVHFCWSLKNLLVLIYSTLHEKNHVITYTYRLRAKKNAQNTYAGPNSISRCNTIPCTNLFNENPN